MPAVVLNVFLSTAIVALTIALASMLFDRKTGLVAGFLMAIWPSELAYVTILASELPFTFLILIGCTLWLARGASNLTRAGASGLMFGVASYFRPIGLLLPIVLWLKDAFEWRKLRAGLPTHARVTDRCRHNDSTLDDTERPGLRSLRADVDVGRGQSMDGKQPAFDRLIFAAAGHGSGIKRV